MLPYIWKYQSGNYPIISLVPIPESDRGGFQQKEAKRPEECHKNDIFRYFSASESGVLGKPYNN